MKRIAVLTSGGDSPGMNACIRAVVRRGLDRGLSVFGVMKGYDGLIDDNMKEMDSTDVSNIIQRGGTVLHSARSPRFREAEYRETAAENLKKRGIDGLVVIGGDGSFRGANALTTEHSIPVVGVPATIDNDIWGTDLTIGYDTAVNTALEAIDKVRDTAAAHDRLFIIEVMGRSAGFIALEVGIGAGAEAVLIPETKTDLPAICDKVKGRIANGRTSNILVVAEGDEAGNAFQIAEKVKKISDLKSRVTVLGHVQRGGSPTTTDRVLASKLGWSAVDALLEEAWPCMVGEVDNEIMRHPLADSWTSRKELDPLLIELATIL
ncbi:MAG: 6-phosphofructokinase [Candidatus Aegiribacteria sp.]|nr:6-phosphofructokinase [Candidatus Aegiribacteria sp.]MBD3294613.1 6-phosphofructokinase [Candidatus Fermentibacteria bacterium]